MSYTFKGFEGELKEGSSGSETTVALVKGVSFTISGGTEPVRAIGSRTPSEFKQGPQEITGTIDKMHFDNRFITNVNSDYPSEMSLVIKATSDAGDTFTVTLGGVVFPELSFDMPAEDYVTESVSFEAKTLSYS